MAISSQTTVSESRKQEELSLLQAENDIVLRSHWGYGKELQDALKYCNQRFDIQHGHDSTGGNSDALADGGSLFRGHGSVHMEVEVRPRGRKRKRSWKQIQGEIADTTMDRQLLRDEKLSVDSPLYGSKRVSNAKNFVDFT